MFDRCSFGKHILEKSIEFLGKVIKNLKIKGDLGKWIEMIGQCVEGGVCGKTPGVQAMETVKCIHTLNNLLCDAIKGKDKCQDIDYTCSKRSRFCP